MTNLDPTKTYYLAHPATSCGEYWENMVDENACFLLLQREYGKAIGMSRGELISLIETRFEPITMIRPLRTIPPTMTDHDEAMRRCFHFLAGCDAIILCGNWQESKGCQMEKEYAELLGLEVLTYEEVVG